MVWVYSAVLLLILFLAVINRGYKRDYFNNTATREDPLKFLFPFAARVLDIITKVLPNATNKRVRTILKQLHVRENTSYEEYIFSVKRISGITVVLMGACALGILLSIHTEGSTAVSSLSRNEYGQGSQYYELEADYDGNEELIELEIPERRMTEEEIYQLFDDSLEEIKEKVLGENESWENVNHPLDLITEFGNIKISWETDDPDLIDYNGELTDELNPGESILMNLKAVFSLDGTEEIFMFPVNITAADLTAREALIKSITEDIESSASQYDSEVSLPKEIGGKKISFSLPDKTPKAMIPVFALIGAAAVWFGYERSLSDKVKKRREQMMADFAEIVFKLSLLYEAGMSIRGAWERIIADAEEAGLLKEHFAFQEMKLASEKIRNGESEARAYGEFGRRCSLHPYIKLGNILQQNLTRGTKGMKELLSEEAREAFEERKRSARKKGEEAGTKMLIPMVMMLVVVIVIVAVPALMTIGF